MQPFTLEFDIYPYQIDLAGHVSNTIYIQWLEMGRIELLKSAGERMEEVMHQECIPVLAETQIVYHRPLYYGDRVRLELRLTEVRGASAWVETRFVNGAGEVVATAKQKGLYVNTKTMRPQRFTPEQRARFEALLLLSAPESEESHARPETE